MATQIIDNDVLDAMTGLSDTAKERVLDFINYIRYQERMEELEDAEDIADAEARRDEPTVPHSVIVADYEAKYGPLD